MHTTTLRRVTAVSLTVLAMLCAWASMSGWDPMPLAVFALPVVLVFGGTGMLVGAGRSSAIAGAVALSVLLTQWPLRAAFLVSQPALERAMVAEEASGMVGVFVVHERRDIVGVPWLVIAQDPAGVTGLVHCHPSYLQSAAVWSSLALGDGWYLVIEE